MRIFTGRFATLEESGLLLYNGRYNELHDFVALEITDGGQSVQFSFSLGADVTKVTASLPATGVNDGKWHTVTVSYYNKVCVLPMWNVYVDMGKCCCAKAFCH